MLEHQPSEDGDWRVVVSAGESAPTRPESATGTAAVGNDEIVAFVGPDLANDERRLLNAFVAQLAVALQSRELRAEAAEAVALTEADALRTALLRAVSHDLRTPLASIKASATTLLARDLHLDASTIRQLEETINDEVDRLAELVTNLLDMSRLQADRRLQAGVLQLTTAKVGIDEIVSRALVSLGSRARAVVVDVRDSLPRVCVDPALVERAVANVVDNAIAWSPPETPVRIEAGAVQQRLILRVIDRGPGIARGDRDRVFQPFQRLTDRPSDGGVGLGLAVARGFIEAVDGELTLEDTPGGGTTMVFTFEVTP